MFGYRDSGNRPLSETLQFLTLYGNQFHDHGPPGKRHDAAINATGAKEVAFRRSDYEKSGKYKMYLH